MHHRPRLRQARKLAPRLQRPRAAPITKERNAAIFVIDGLTGPVVPAVGNQVPKCKRPRTAVKCVIDRLRRSRTAGALVPFADVPLFRAKRKGRCGHITV